MLTENRIVDLVCDQLELDGFTVSQKLDTTQTGIDIVAVSETGKKYFVEAKGATSSKESTKRYGQEFNKSQVKTHIGMALVAAFKVREDNPDHESIIALPNNLSHKELIESMATPIRLSGIKVWLVDEERVEKLI
ncbi:hypothetical protein R7M92_24240 [Vibrio sp. Vb2880]|uniref:hypothetical protein n=1 Tax=Vibrio TaxID=662 RepID=UPI002964F2A2|nr:hypothetical protein [Vibrio sp. Vb2880]MDW1578876.1 hypothetical protein [Vibrio sp. Vb2880]